MVLVYNIVKILGPPLTGKNYIGHGLLSSVKKQELKIIRNTRFNRITVKIMYPVIMAPPKIGFPLFSQSSYHANNDVHARAASAFKIIGIFAAEISLQNLLVRKQLTAQGYFG